MGGPYDAENKKNRVIDFSTAKAKIAKYCAYQERAHKEVAQKLYSFGLFSSQVDEILAWLITENYVNEERYAIAYSGGKFRMKQWGKIKIRQQLKLKGVSQYSIDKALSLIEADDYLTTTQELIRKKRESTSADNLYELRNKVARYVINKGYEPEQVWEHTKNIIV